MPIELSKQKLIELLGGADTNPSQKLVFNSIATRIDEISGGELWIGIESDTLENLEKAFKRGATLALTSCPTFQLTCKEPERIICVPSLELALKKIALWWLSTCNAKAIFICANTERVVLKELLARILIKKSRGAYNIATQTSYLLMLKTICSLHKDSEWLVLDTESPMCSKTVELIQELQLSTLILDEINSQDIHVIQRALTTSLSSYCVVANPDLINKDFENRYKLCLSEHNDHIQNRNVSTELQILNSKLLGVNGVSFELKSQSETQNIETSVLGPRVGELLAMASVVAQHIYTDLPLREIFKTISSIPSGIIPPILHPLTDNRVLLADIEQANLKDLDKIKDIILAGKIDYKNFAIIFGELCQYGNNIEIQSKEDHLYYIAELCKLKPEFVVCYGRFSCECVVKIKEFGIKAFQASSVDEAGHIAMKLPFDMLVVKSSKTTGLHRTVQLLTERHGVAPRPPEPTFKI